MQNYCYDPLDPCEGFFCGGADRGICQLNGNNEPQCLCAPGFQNNSYALYCCPENILDDPNCVGAEAGQSGSAGQSDGGGESGGDSGGSTGG